MIKLSKLPKPLILQQNATAWTEVLLTKIAAGQLPTAAEKSRYRHKDVKDTLIAETHGKCAYCESKIKHIHHGDVEHIFPKSLDPSLQFEWENLTLACEICNQNKSNLDPIAEHILDPYIDDPSAEIFFAGALAFPLGTPKGRSSITILDLNRTALVEIRYEAVERIMSIVDVIFRDDTPNAVKHVIFNDLKSNEASVSAQYSALVNHLLVSLDPKLTQALSTM